MPNPTAEFDQLFAMIRDLDVNGTHLLTAHALGLASDLNAHIVDYVETGDIPPAVTARIGITSIAATLALQALSGTYPPPHDTQELTDILKRIHTIVSALSDDAE